MLPKDEHITATFQQGGVEETMRTGIYPEHLIIHSELHQTTWTRKATGGRSKGILKVNKQKVYRFQFNGSGFFIQMIVDGNPVGDWEPVDLIYVLAD